MNPWSLDEYQKRLVHQLIMDAESELSAALGEAWDQKADLKAQVEHLKAEVDALRSQLNLQERFDTLIELVEVRMGAKDDQIKSLQAALAALDDGRASSFIETLRAKEHEIRLLKSELEVLKAMR